MMPVVSSVLNRLQILIFDDFFENSIRLLVLAKNHITWVAEKLTINSQK